MPTMANNASPVNISALGHICKTVPDTSHTNLCMSHTKFLPSPKIGLPPVTSICGNQNHLQHFPSPYCYIQFHPTPVTSTCGIPPESVLFFLFPQPPTMAAFLVAAIVSQLICFNLLFLQLIHSPSSSLSDQILRLNLITLVLGLELLNSFRIYLE